MALSSPCRCVDLVLGDRDAREMRDAADGVGVDGHESRYRAYSKRLSARQPG